MGKSALKLRMELINFLRRNPVVIDFLYTEGVVSSVQAYMLSKYPYVYE